MPKIDINPNIHNQLTAIGRNESAASSIFPNDS